MNQLGFSTVHPSTVPEIIDLTSPSPKKDTTKMSDMRRYPKTEAALPSCFRGPEFTKVKVSALLKVYDIYTKYPDPSQIKKTAELLGLTAKQVLCWFRNRRARERRQRRYMQYLELRKTRFQPCSPCLSSSTSIDSGTTTSSVSPLPSTPNDDTHQSSFEFPGVPCMFQSSPDSAPSPSFPPSPSSHFDAIQPSYNLSWSPDAVDSCFPGHGLFEPLPLHADVTWSLQRYGDGCSGVLQSW
ncbi:homeobox protein SIX2-like [Ptychodera flava]|uniref:homeobox protein SIX2-like n=1 Tax=Ptychodera flava TaxID=63121 RepID=UPI00396A45C2